MPIVATDHSLRLRISGRDYGIAWIWLVLLAAAALRLLSYQGLRGADDINYLWHAREIALGTYQLHAHPFMNRYGLLLPEALLYLVFGARMWALTLYPFGLGLVLVYLTCRLGLRLTGKEPVGLLAALLVAALPIAVDESTNIVTDLPSAVFITLSLLLVFSAADLAGRRRKLYLFLSGLSLGWAYLCKEQTVVVFPVFAVFFMGEAVKDWRKAWSWWALALGAVIIPSIESLYYYHAAGNALLRYTGVDTSCNVAPWYAREVIAQGLLARRLYLDLIQGLLTRVREFGNFFPLAAAGTAWAFTTEDKRPRLVAVWLWLYLLCFNFISTSVTEYLPLLVVPRYLLPAVAPAAVLAGGLLYEMMVAVRTMTVSRAAWAGSVALLAAAMITVGFQQILHQFIFLALSALAFTAVALGRRGAARGAPGRGWKAAPVALLVWQLIMIVYVLLTPHPVRPFTRMDAKVLKIVNQEPGLPVYADQNSVMIFQFLDRFSRPDRFLDYSGLKEAPAHGFLWKQDHRIALLKKNGVSVPDFVLHPDAGWKIIMKRSFKDEDYILYKIE